MVELCHDNLYPNHLSDPDIINFDCLFLLNVTIPDVS